MFTYIGTASTEEASEVDEKGESTNMDEQENKADVDKAQGDTSDTKW